MAAATNKCVLDDNDDDDDRNRDHKVGAVAF